MLNRRLIAPTIFFLVLFALFVDYLFMSEWRWSVSRFIGKVFGVLTAIVSHPALFSLIESTSVPILLSGLALVLLFLTIAKAKRAMRQATPDASTGTLTAAAKATEAPLRIEPSSPIIVVPRGHTRRNRLMNIWTYSFTFVSLVFGMVICLSVFSVLGRAIEKQAKNRAGVMSLGLGEIVAPTLASGQFNAVSTAIEKFATTNSVAYLYIEDAEGRVIANWPRDLLRYLQRDFPHSTERALRGIDVKYQGVDTYEVAKRIGEGKLGFIHLAIWRRDIDAEAYPYTMAIAAMISIVLFCIAGCFLLISRSLLGPLTDLVEQAARLNDGEFDMALKLQRSDEFGDIALSLERLRSSLRFAADRLDNEDSSQYPDELNKAPRPMRER